MKDKNADRETVLNYFNSLPKYEENKFKSNIAFVQDSGNTYLFNHKTKEIRKVDKDGKQTVITDKNLIKRFNTKISALK